MIELYRRHVLDSKQHEFPVPVDWWTFPGGDISIMDSPIDLFCMPAGAVNPCHGCLYL